MCDVLVCVYAEVFMALSAASGVQTQQNQACQKEPYMYMSSRIPGRPLICAHLPKAAMYHTKDQCRAQTSGLKTLIQDSGARAY